MGRRTTIALALMFILGSGQANAQGYQRPQTSPFPSSPVSPYLNLMRGGNAAINYYGLVRPQQDTASALMRLQQQQQFQAGQPPVTNAALSITGHPATFMNYSHFYYYNMGINTPVSGIRGGVAGGAALPYSGYIGNPIGLGAGIPSFSFVTGTGILRP